MKLFLMASLTSSVTNGAWHHSPRWKTKPLTNNDRAWLHLRQRRWQERSHFFPAVIYWCSKNPLCCCRDVETCGIRFLFFAAPFSQSATWLSTPKPLPASCAFCNEPTTNWGRQLSNKSCVKLWMFMSLMSMSQHPNLEKKPCTLPISFSQVPGLLHQELIPENASRVVRPVPSPNAKHHQVPLLQLSTWLPPSKDANVY